MTPTTVTHKSEIAIHVKKHEPLRQEIEAFLKCVANNETPITDIQEALNVQIVLNMIEKKLKRNTFKIMDLDLKQQQNLIRKILIKELRKCLITDNIFKVLRLVSLKMNYHYFLNLNLFYVALVAQMLLF